MKEYTILIDEDTLAFYEGLGRVLDMSCGEVITKILMKKADNFAAKFTELLGSTEDTTVYYDQQKKRP